MLDRSEVGKRGYLDRDFRLVHLKDSLAQKIDYHYHEFDKLVIFLGGKVTYVVEGVTYFLKPWDIVLIQHNLIHRPIIHAEEPYERAVLWLGRDWIAQRSDPGEPLDACLDKSREQGFHLLRTGEEGRLGYARSIQQLEEADAFQIARPSENRSFQATHRAVEIISCFSSNGKMIVKNKHNSVIPETVNKVANSPRR